MLSAGSLIICFKPKVVITKMWAEDIHGLGAIISVSGVYHDRTLGLAKVISEKMC